MSRLYLIWTPTPSHHSVSASASPIPLDHSAVKCLESEFKFTAKGNNGSSHLFRYTANSWKQILRHSINKQEVKMEDEKMDASSGREKQVVSANRHQGIHRGKLRSGTRNTKTFSMIQASKLAHYLALRVLWARWSKQYTLIAAEMERWSTMWATACQQYSYPGFSRRKIFKGLLQLPNLGMCGSTELR